MQKFGIGVILLTLPLVGRAAPPKSTNAAPQQAIQSTFAIPRSPDEGRDPFYPKSTSLYQTAVYTSKPEPEAGISLLKLKGILGSSYVNINNVTLAVGETEEVKTAAGPVSVRLVEIHAADSTVIIEANGQRRQLSSDSLARNRQ